MQLFDEKRTHDDRRAHDQGPPAGRRERRAQEDRRQTQIAEISLLEWDAQRRSYEAGKSSQRP